MGCTASITWLLAHKYRALKWAQTEQSGHNEVVLGRSFAPRQPLGLLQVEGWDTHPFTESQHGLDWKGP